MRRRSFKELHDIGLNTLSIKCVQSYADKRANVADKQCKQQKERQCKNKQYKIYVPDRGSVFPLFLSFSSSPLSYQVISHLTPTDKSDGTC